MWPAEAVYGVVTAAAIVENVFPPAPADVVIALAAFLSHRGLTTAGTVFLVTWIANVTGAVSVYLLARMVGPRFVQSRVGRRLITPSAIVVVEREYLRYGLLGLFLARLLPGVRSFTAPFAGLVGLSLPKTILPIALASGLWYGVLVWVGARVGANWEAVDRIVTGLNRTLLVLTVVAGLGIAAWVLLRRRRRADRVRRAVEAGLEEYPALESRALEDPGSAAVAGLLLATTLSGIDLSEGDLAALEQHLRSRWHLPDPGGTQPRADAAVATRVIASMQPEAKLGLARRLVEVAFKDGRFGGYQGHVVARAAQLLGLSHDDLTTPGRGTSA